MLVDDLQVAFRGAAGCVELVVQGFGGKGGFGVGNEGFEVRAAEGCVLRHCVRVTTLA